jgi:SAM-dependent methyltransferase
VTLLGKDVVEEIRGKDVLDFGCGKGAEAIEMAAYARSVVGLDIRQDHLAIASEHAQGVNNCTFVTSTDRKFDVVVSLDAFEHFGDPAGVLKVMHSMLHDEGTVIFSFGPTWFHPLGGHLFSVFPWAHLLFSEHSLIAWRSRFRHDGATRFGEVEGGLNQMTISRFKRIVRDTGFESESFDPVPIRRLAFLANPLTQEFTTAIVRGRLRKKVRAK